MNWLLLSNMNLIWILLKVFKSGFVVCLDMLFLGGLLDDRVVDFGCYYCFVFDVKCLVINIKLF